MHECHFVILRPIVTLHRRGSGGGGVGCKEPPPQQLRSKINESDLCQISVSTSSWHENGRGQRVLLILHDVPKHV